MYKLQIVEAITYLMGAKDSSYSMMFGIDYPLIFRESDREVMEGLRKAFKVRNSIMLSNYDDRQLSLSSYRPELITPKELNYFLIDDDMQNENQEEALLSILKNTESYIRVNISVLFDYKEFKQHYMLLCDFFKLTINTVQDLKNLKEEILVTNFKFPMGIFIPRFNECESKGLLKFLFKNDYLFLKKVYAMSDRKINLYLDYYSNTTNKALGEIDAIVTSKQSYEVFVDCENVNSAYAYLLVEHLSKLEQVKRINLFYCSDLSFRWELIKGKNIYHYSTTRIVSYKNSSDILLGNRVAEAIYSRGCKDVMIVSGDSDYFSIIQSTPEVQFTVLISGNASKYYVNKLNYLNVKNYNLQEVFDILDILSRLNAKTSYYTDTIASLLYDEDKET